MTDQQLIKPRKALNPAYLKVKPNRSDIERFKNHLIALLDQSNDKESEEFHKNLVSDFLKKTWYDPNHFINTKGRNDLVIHNGPKANTEVGVIIEAKKPTNKTEMPSKGNLNSKAFQELILYYLRERITHKNNSVRHLVVTNIYEWYIVDALHFDRLFAQNKKLVRDFEEFEAGRLADTKTDFFYKNVAEPELEKAKDKIPFTFFDFREYDKPLRNADKADDAKLIALFKLLSPEHLLKLPFANDSNSLDKRFYAELLHLIGLEEKKDGGKKIIGRPKKEDRLPGSLLENTINQLKTLDLVSRLDRPSQYGDTEDDRLFAVGLELCITWVNRILFLKLLEAQLISYNKGNRDFGFLSSGKISDYDELNSLFFGVLAKQLQDREEDLQAKFAQVPYLNSSLFEATEMEYKTLYISNLKDDRTIPLHSGTVLKDSSGKKRSGELNTLEYFFRFLDAYDFSSEGSEEIQEENKTLINASVLGLIFEKINGYKDGSFFTPGFITMYMCRETIRRAVVQKFNEALNTLTPNPSPSRRGEQPRIELQGQKISPELLEHAREMRKNQTPAEEFLWNLLRNRRFLGYKFRRQHPVAQKYIIDFFCDELRLGVELDGDYHLAPDQKEYDEGRTYELEEFGIKIIRFSNDEVLWETEKVLETIRQCTDHQSPLSSGRGAGGEGLSNQEARAGNFSSPLGEDTGLRELENFDDLYDLIGPGGKFSYAEANALINSLKICDPAVGSGHFLVSALNEIIAVKNDLRILQDRSGKRLKEYSVAVVNDELVVTDEDGELFDYNPNNPESQRIQETLFHEKQTIIENCLFGVDINPNSVKICRLRLWIELLKSAYYKNPSLQTSLPQGERLTLLSIGRGAGGGRFPSPLGEGAGVRELETLPNIDINIKCGNSLVSRFALDADLSQALKSIKYSINEYRGFVTEYRNASNKDHKRGLELILKQIKENFKSNVDDGFKEKISKARALVTKLLTQINTMQQWGEKIPQSLNKELEKALEKQSELEKEKADILNNKIFENAFEWRFEFPEVLNESGEFVGFDVVIGNPPYMRVQEIQKTQPLQKAYYESTYQNARAAYDLANIFFELAVNISSSSSFNSYIFPHKFFNSASAEVFRDYLREGKYIDKIAHFGANMIFEDADTYTCVAQFSKNPSEGFWFRRFSYKSDFQTLMNQSNSFGFITYEQIEIASRLYGGNQWILFDNSLGIQLFSKIYQDSKKLESVLEGIFQGLATSKDDLYVVDCIDNVSFKIIVPLSGKSYDLEREFFKPFLMGKDVQRYSSLNTNKFVFFPYRITNESAEIVDIIELRENYPLTYNYLIDHEKDFKSRESGKAGKMKHWYAYIYPKNLNKFEQLKLTSMEICSIHPNVTLNNSNLYHTTKAYSWVKNEDATESYEYLLALANSKLLWWFLKLTGDTLQGDARTFKTNYLNPFPLPETPDPRIENEIEQKINKILELKKVNNNSDTKILEKEIDDLVFELYGLTEEERKIVEGGEG
ncbi:Eco57I restriction-modification methylase domain-containing protein [Algoriphagus aquatilis]|uniref:site-specific DNA-methyltransferase (adenine-specific) n=1 Tax=Algoriphagus aquatilis TaxID=490186 RepID=A0ABW0BUH7_9BACT